MSFAKDLDEIRRTYTKTKFVGMKLALTMKRYKNRGIIFVTGVLLILYISRRYLPSTQSYNLTPIHFNAKSNVIEGLEQIMVFLQQPEKFASHAEKLKLIEKLKDAIYLIDDSYKFKEASSSKPTSPYSCPETFIEGKIGRPYYLNGTWKQHTCEILSPIHEVLTLVLLFSNDNFCSNQLETLLNSFRRDKLTNPIVIAIPDESSCMTISRQDLPDNIGIIDFPSGIMRGEIWNKLVARVTTPFILIGRNLQDFNWFTNLQRQVSVFAVDPRIKIVGGSVRNETGHWQVGCYQTRLIDYVLEFKDGYRHSINECMICDHLLGSFIAKTDFLKEHKFNKNLSEAIIFEDFFLKIKSPSVLIANCPDAMYMSTDPGEVLRVIEKSTWLPLIQKLSINRIILPNGVTHEFTCKESNLGCSPNQLNGGTMSFMMPLCCMDAFVNGLKQFHEFCVRHDIVYQIEGGTLLGAIKLRNIIPWDVDGDGTYYAKDKPFFSKELNLSNENGKVFINDLHAKTKGFFKVSTPDAFIEFFPLDKLTADVCGLGDVFVRMPTLVEIKGVWVYAPPSPGFTARNLYGTEYLRHVNDWYNVNKDLYAAFLPCIIPGHHACLDQFAPDGNFQFEFI